MQFVTDKFLAECIVSNTKRFDEKSLYNDLKLTNRKSLAVSFNLFKNIKDYQSILLIKCDSVYLSDFNPK